MEMEVRGKEMVFNKELNSLDKFVIEFCKLLEESEIEYVIVSGYVSILFGRSRITEDIDMFIMPASKERFEKFYALLKKKNFWIINSPSAEDAFEMLSEGLAIRAAENGKSLPNFEIKFAKKEDDFYSLKNRLKIILSRGFIFISPLEMHVAYKLKLGGDKDFEDSYHVYKLMKKYMNLEELKRLIRELKVEDIARKELSDLYV